MKIAVLLLGLLAVGCTSTTTLQVEKVEDNVRDGLSFKISSREGPSSEVIKYLPHDFCNMGFTASVSKVYDESEWNPNSRVTFSSSKNGQSFSILFYYDKSNKNILPLIMHSEDETAEPLGMAFSLGEKITSMIYYENLDLGVSLAPSSKMDSIINHVGETKHTEEFDFSVVDIGFKPDQVKFLGVSIDSVFDSIYFSVGC
ncbi:hypothetical protein [Paraglaciecola sp. MB-3u-78]|uniref:hypothetical protein n=1 Tax=Paraglaciecola sp. MB-3u-78 TaxID=2058332 RepID=UPI000C32F9C6|nr:hypothetical protein [Paraglaciecola sp. MB-3u-78]PKH00227.1 hypothetical protein CXF95_06375 [Paraglaciecola sp. MB-3u-78]